MYETIDQIYISFIDKYTYTHTVKPYASAMDKNAYATKTSVTAVML